MLKSTVYEISSLDLEVVSGGCRDGDFCPPDPWNPGPRPKVDPFPAPPSPTPEPGLNFTIRF